MLKLPSISGKSGVTAKTLLHVRQIFNGERGSPLRSGTDGMEDHLFKNFLLERVLRGFGLIDVHAMR